MLGNLLFTFLECDEVSRQAVANLFSFPVFDISDGFKYLGYRIKPNSYSLNDWSWLVVKN
jgi:hypothetical protein